MALITGTESSELLTDTLGGANELLGLGGDDTLVGAGGDDTLDGGQGSDTASYASSTAAINVNLATGVATDGLAGTDLLISIERVIGTGFNDTLVGADGSGEHLEGRAGDDSLVGGGGNDTLDGGSGVDSMVGGQGNDTYFVDDFSDVYTELESEGVDTIITTAGGSLAANIENLKYVGAGSDGVFGNALDNFIGTLHVSMTLGGGDGNDTVSYADETAALTINLAGGATTGNAITDTLFAFENAEGGLNNDSMIGTAAANVLNGMGGADTLHGGFGDDIYYVDDAGDVVVEDSNTPPGSLVLPGGGAGPSLSAIEGITDLVVAAISYSLENLTYVEDLSLSGTATVGTGNSLANVLTGTDLANTLLSLEGDDTVEGLAGNDSLDGGANNDMLNGGDGVDTLTGGGGNDTLDGGGGNDSLAGGADNDTFIVDAAGDVVFENAGEGTADLVQSSAAAYTLSGNVENLTLTGAALTGAGNTLANALTGNAQGNTLTGGGGDDTLDGGSGADTLDGGADNDTYYVDAAGDVVIEIAGEGSADLVLSAVDHVLGANVENLTLTGAALAGTGNTLANALTGNAQGNTLAGGDGADTLDGAGGADTLTGGAGDDTLDGGAGSGDFADYRFAAAAVSVDLFAGTASGSSTGTDQLGGIENVAGTDFNDSLTGDAQGNLLDGDSGSDTLNGAGGNDTLDGGLGMDTLTGGAGSDAYVMRATATGGPDGITFLYQDVISETGADADTVYSNSSHTLAAGMENLTLTGAPLWRAYVGTGNELDNVITGAGAARQRLYGEGGADTLDGGAGRDLLDGGAGDDTLIYDSADTSIDGGLGDDTLLLDGAGVALDLAGLAGTAIQDIEVIDLTGSGNNTLTLSASDVLAISSTDALRIDGDAGDVVSSTGQGWVAGGTVEVFPSVFYQSYTDGAAILLLDPDIAAGSTIN